MNSTITITLTPPLAPAVLERLLALQQTLCTDVPFPCPAPAAPGSPAQPVQPATQAPAQPPAATVPQPAQIPTAAPAFTHDQLALAASGLAEKSQQDWQNVSALLQKFGVQGVAFLKPEQMGPFATELRVLGAQI